MEECCSHVLQPRLAESRQPHVPARQERCSYRPKPLSASSELSRLHMNARLSALYILQILVKDSNVVCVAEAAACFEALAKGLRKEFSTIAKGHFGTILDKLKDKSTNVCTQSAAACLTFHK